MREGKRERVMELYTQPNANGLHYRSLSLSLFALVTRS